MRQSPYKGPPPSKEDLIRVYVEGGVSLAEAGRQLGGASSTLVKRWLKENGLRPHTLSEARAAIEAREKSEEEMARRRASAAAMRAKLTPESHRQAGEKLRGRPGTMLGRRHSDEAKARIRATWTEERRDQFAAARMGEKTAFYIDGRSGEPDAVRVWRWKKLKAECYERDGWTCQECGLDLSPEARRRHGLRIQSHHIVARRHGGADTLENLVTLCNPCHTRIEWRSWRSASIPSSTEGGK